jgi:2-furoyl-CoA dehydrogenase FAD binding subunit
MKPASFDYVRAESRREVLELLAEAGSDARVLAGGQSLMAVLNMRLAQPRLLIDITAVEDLTQVGVSNGQLVVGAAVRQAELMARPSLADEVPLLARAMPWVGHYQTRNSGTVCGSIAHGDPSAELPLCLVTLGGEVVLESSTGRRQVAAGDFFQGVLTTDRRDDELITEVRFPVRRDASRHEFAEVAMRHGDFAIVALAAVVNQGQARLGVGGVADRPVCRELAVDESLPSRLNEFAWELRGEDDQHASAAYRRQMVRELGRELIEGRPQ